MPGLARVSDQSDHPGVLAGPGVVSVRVAGLPAAVFSDNHVCAFPSGNPPSPVAKGSAVVRIGGRPAARIGDIAGCGAHVIVGAFTVEVGG